ncbi:3032_t:CDS:2, partial [Acaulospora morrowiae]
CLQFNPIIGEVERNQKFASKLLERFTARPNLRVMFLPPLKTLSIRLFNILNNIRRFRPNDFDILVLPEMAFTGYVFKNKKHIEPFLEDAEAGTTVQWAKNQAMRLHAFVMVGYPQIVKGNPDKFYNSVCFVGPDGELIDT